MFKKFRLVVHSTLLTTVLVSGVCSSTAGQPPQSAPAAALTAAQVPSPSLTPASAASQPAVAKTAQAKTPAKAVAPVRYVPNLSKRAEMYYQGAWGVDELKLKYTESGEIIRFSYRVLDPAKAAALNDKRTEPALYAARAGVKLVVPQMEKVGQLRQSGTPVAGKSYWMAFSNSGRPVRPGDRVSVEIGQFHAINLVVE